MKREKEFKKIFKFVKNYACEAKYAPHPTIVAFFTDRLVLRLLRNLPLHFEALFIWAFSKKGGCLFIAFTALLARTWTFNTCVLGFAIVTWKQLG